MAINLIFDPKVGIRNYTLDEIKENSTDRLLKMSTVQVAILFRKAVSGIKSVLKMYKNAGLEFSKYPNSYKLMNMKENDNVDQVIEELSGTNTNTLSMRIELFVSERNWKESNQFCKEFLLAFISQFEDKIAQLILNWNEYRFTLHVLSKENNYRQYIESNIPFYSLKNDVPDKANHEEYKFILTNNLNPVEDRNKFNFFKDIELKSRYKLNNYHADKINLLSGLNFNHQPLPMYIISTRDCFVFDLISKSETIELDGRKYIKKEFFFDESNVPSNYYKFQTNKNEFPVGIVTYENYFTHDELLAIEKNIEKTEELSLKEAFLPETAQKTFAGEKIKRTKFFFGSRYIWTKKQLAEPNSYVGAGIRKDVSPAPYWIKKDIEDPLVNSGIILKDFLNSYALNVYHDGSEGLGQHFDDAVRFKQVYLYIKLADLYITTFLRLSVIVRITIIWFL
jgi:hypothetical protein